MSDLFTMSVDHSLNERQRTFVISTLATRQCSEICERFSSSGIKLVLLKGVVFARSLYDDPAQRDMTDIDLLVEPADNARAAELLRGLAYVPDNTFASRFGFGAVIEKTYRRPNLLPVELHNSVATGRGARRLSEAIFQATQPAPSPYDLPGIYVATPEQTLVALALHFRDHGLMMTDYQAEDVRRLIDRQTPNMERVQRLASLAGAQLTLEQMLLAAGNLSLGLEGLSPGLRLKSRLMRVLLRPRQGGFAPRIPIEGIRAAERAWRLFVHVWLARDDLRESVGSQADHLRFEKEALSRWWSERGQK